MNQSVGMPPVTFKTTRLRRGNFLFPATVAVTEKEVIFEKKYVVFRRKKRISINDIGSIHIKNFLFSSEVLFKNLNGGNPLTVVGLRKSDAHRVRQLVEKTLGV